MLIKHSLTKFNILHPFLPPPVTKCSHCLAPFVSQEPFPCTPDPSPLHIPALAHPLVKLALIPLIHHDTIDPPHGRWSVVGVTGEMWRGGRVGTNGRKGWIGALRGWRESWWHLTRSLTDHTVNWITWIPRWWVLSDIGSWSNVIWCVLNRTHCAPKLLWPSVQKNELQVLQFNQLCPMIMVPAKENP